MMSLASSKIPLRAPYRFHSFDVVVVLIEDLNPVVIAVTHEQASYGIEGQRIEERQIRPDHYLSFPKS
jgi:hypothetical protein